MSHIRSKQSPNDGRRGQMVPLVQWLFTRDGKSLTCVAAAGEDRSYEVAVVAHWNEGPSIVERESTPGAALQRHARIAMMLRDAGWVVARRSN